VREKAFVDIWDITDILYAGEDNMKAFKKLFPVFVIVCGLFLSCMQSPIETEPTYTVWTGSMTYTMFNDATGLTLPDGYFTYNEASQSTIKTYTNYFGGQKEWTKNQINDFLIGRNFSSSDAERVSSWAVTIEHGYLFTRTGSIVYYLFI